MEVAADLAGLVGPEAGAALAALGLAAAALAALAVLRAALGLAVWALEPRGAPLAVPLEPEEKIGHTGARGRRWWWRRWKTGP